jgi:hypothetical protein
MWYTLFLLCTPEFFISRFSFKLFLKNTHHNSPEIQNKPDSALNPNPKPQILANFETQNPNPNPNLIFFSKPGTQTRLRSNKILETQYPNRPLFVAGSHPWKYSVKKLSIKKFKKKSTIYKIPN